MAPWTSIVKQLRTWAGAAPADQTDAELLRRFVDARDAEAFNALMARHGGLVWNVCRRTAADLHQAEDAYQAVFLVLLHKANGLRLTGSLAGWLHRVAYRVALRSKTLGRRQSTVSEVTTLIEPSLDQRDTEAVVDEELDRLPHQERQALILCHLQGRTHEQAAGEIGCPRGSMAKLVSRAEGMLRDRLARRGFGAVAFGAVAQSAQAVPAAVQHLAETTIQQAMAGEAVGPAVLALAEGVMHDMFWSKTKIVASVVFALAILGGGATLMLADGPANPKKPEPAAKASGLPDGAIARLGSKSWNQDQRVDHVAASSTGKHVATTGGKNLYVWDAKSGSQLHRFEADSDINAIKFSADGKLLAAGTNAGKFLIVDLEQGKQTINVAIGGASPLMFQVHDVAFHPDDKQIVTASNNGLQFWDMTTGNETKAREKGSKIYNTILFSADGKRALTCTGNAFDVLEVDGWKKIGSFTTQDHYCPAVFSPDGNSIIVRDLHEVVLRETADPKKEKKLKVEKLDGRGTVASAPDGKSVVLNNTLDKGLALVDLEGKPIWTIDGKAQVMTCSGDHVFAGIGNRIHVLPLKTGKADSTGDHSGVILSCRFSRDGKNLWTTAADGGVTTWQIPEGKQLKSHVFWPGAWTYHIQVGGGERGYDVNGVSFSADGTRTLVRKNDRLIVADALSGKEVCALGTASTGVIAPDGKMAYTIDQSTITAWNAGDGKKVREFGHERMDKRGEYWLNVIALDVSPNGEKIVSVFHKVTTREGGRGTYGTNVHVWDAQGRELYKIDEEMPLVSTIRFSPDGKSFATIDKNQRIRVWETDSGKERTGKTELTGTAVAFAPDGKQIAIGTKDRKVRVWNVQDDKEERLFDGHTGNITTLSFSDDGKLLASGSADTTVLIWNLAK